MKKMLIMLMALMMIASSAFAEKITFIETATYHLGSGDSEITAHEGARKECIKKAAAAGGVYVETYSKEVMFELTAQETEMIAASVIKAVEIEGESGMSKDRMNYDITMECTLDTDDIWKALLTRKNNKEKINLDNETPIQNTPTKNITSNTTAHAFILNLDPLKVTPTSSPDYFWLATDYLIIETESGRKVMELLETKLGKWVVRRMVTNGSHGFDSRLKEYVDTRWGDDYEIIYPVKAKEYGEEKMGFIERKKHKSKHVIVVTDEDGAKINQIIDNNPGGQIPLDHILITWLM